jgi:predicted nucleic acid-binding protein
MVLIDTSVWINVFADKQGDYSSHLNELLAGREIYLTRFQQLELLQGCRNEKEWGKLSDYLEGQDYLETQVGTWQAAARIYYELRKMGVTIRSPIDLCIAQIDIENKILLIHDDRDFTAISSLFPLQQKRWPRNEAGDTKLHEEHAQYKGDLKQDI